MALAGRPGARLAALLQLAFLALVPLPAAASPQLLEVAADGSGDFTTIQAAIDQAPAGGADWNVIHIAAGHYFEKVTVPSGRGPIVLVGDGRDTTVLEFDESFRDGTGALEGRPSAASGEDSLLTTSGPIHVGQRVAKVLAGSRSLLDTERR